MNQSKSMDTVSHQLDSLVVHRKYTKN